MDKGLKQEVESKVCDAVRRFFEEQMGEYADVVTAKVVDDAIIVRFKDVLSPAEKHMINDQQGGAVIKDLKERLIEKIKPLLEAMIRNLTATEVVDIHSSFESKTGERVEVFVLGKSL